MYNLFSIIPIENSFAVHNKEAQLYPNLLDIIYPIYILSIHSSFRRTLEWYTRPEFLLYLSAFLLPSGEKKPSLRHLKFDPSQCDPQGYRSWTKPLCYGLLDWNSLKSWFYRDKLHLICWIQNQRIEIYQVWSGLSYSSVWFFWTCISCLVPYKANVL